MSQGNWSATTRMTATRSTFARAADCRCPPKSFTFRSFKGSIPGPAAAARCTALHPSWRRNSCPAGASGQAGPVQAPRHPERNEAGFSQYPQIILQDSPSFRRFNPKGVVARLEKPNSARWMRGPVSHYTHDTEREWPEWRPGRQSRGNRSWAQVGCSIR